jgi:putative flippase GtrA
MKNRILPELRKFLFIGTIAVCLDWGFYLTLTNFFGVEAVLAKVISYIIGTVFSFIANGRIVFQADLARANFLRHLLLYALSLLVNTLAFGSLKSFFSSDSSTSLAAPLLTATFASTVINFVGMRFWVFKNTRKSHAGR